MAAAALTGGAAGGAVGLLGSVAGAGAVDGGVVAIAAVMPALLLSALGIHVPLPQRDVETPRAWVGGGPLRWATFTGAMLGFGALTRLGYWAWYLIPLSTFVSQSLFSGLIIWATYAVVRTSGSIVLGLDQVHDASPDYRRQLRLLTIGRARARTITNLVGAAVAVGLVTSIHS